ncbi:hypothetical protein WMF31_41845 [Sorangium sp. So ce1036]|uniref:hypothetical protein n=1 Tax=Sorangium sp. So ce1036 TaxID=3133328 RepID=UPI003F07FF3C
MDERIKELEWAVRALAQEFDVQRSLFPPFVCVADELALEFEECVRKIPSNVRLVLLTDEQDAHLKALDDKLDAMSGPENIRFWTDDALRHDPEWSEVRRLSVKLIEAMGWSSMPPPPSSDIYVGPDA